MKKKDTTAEKGMDLANDIAKIIQDRDLKTTPDDYPSFKETIQNNSYSSELISKLCDEEYLSKSVSDFERKEKAESLSKFNERMEFKMRSRIRNKKMIKYASSYAAAIIVLSFLVYGLISRSEIMPEYITNTLKPKITVPTLIYGDEISVGILNKDIDKVIANLGDEEESKSDGKEVVKYNTIIVPNQFTYIVKLPDSSIVTINANSELRYPRSFTSKERRIFLKGEAFFHVTKSDIPFVVSTEKGNIKVYGTDFNINLNRNNMLQVALVNGSVGVTPGNGNMEVIMIPKDVLEYHTYNGTNLIKDAVIENYISWLDGGFKYNKIEFTHLLEELSAWYGVRFEYARKIDNMPISINVDRNIELNKLLNILETMTNVRFIKEKGGLYSVN